MPSPKRKSPDPDHDAPFEDAATPAGSPPRKKLRITRAQKQALIDNLQLEITERARKLRAQYALQANDLRARIERRVNRIPVSLRKATMGELLEKHKAAARNPTASSTTAKKSAPSSKISKNAASAAAQRTSPTKLTQTPRKTKRMSQENYSDKENTPAVGSPADVLKNPKKRGKPAVAGGATDYRILSPKSLNSRTYPQSPFRTSPEKAHHSSYLTRPTSPLKPFSPFKTGSSSSVARPATAVGDHRPTSPAKKATTNRAATGPKSVKSPLSRPATRQHERKISSGTVSSSASSGMTVLKPTRTGTGARKAATVTSTPGVMAKKPTVARGQAASMAVKKTSVATAPLRKATAPAAMDAPATGRRVLRKRV